MRVLSRHCERSEAIQMFSYGFLDCFALYGARNDSTYANFIIRGYLRRKKLKIRDASSGT